MPKLISFFGTLGSGKTTRARLLAGFLDVPFYSELADSPFLEDMFLEKKNALLNQLHFLYRDRNEIIEKYNRCDTDVLIFDYHIAQVDAFSKHFLSSEEYQEFSQHYQGVVNQLPLPDLVIYLHLDSELNFIRVQARNRTHEKVDKEFLSVMQDKQKEHLEKLKEKTQVLELDSSTDIIGSLDNRLEVIGKIVSKLPQFAGNLTNTT
jgi:deoxyguanosine kinase